MSAENWLFMPSTIYWVTFGGMGKKTVAHLFMWENVAVANFHWVSLEHSIFHSIGWLIIQYSGFQKIPALKKKANCKIVNCLSESKSNRK